VDAIKQFSKSRTFEYTIIGLIIFTAGLIAFEAFPQWMTPGIAKTFDHLHNIILIAFIIEAIIKLVALSPRPWLYFKSGWNVFDFSLIVLSLINALPELRLIVETLLKSIPSMFHITILMSILFFIYGVLGFHLFHEHDPTHWRDLAYSLLTLFRIVTLEDWTDVMYKAMELSPIYALYFVSFVVIGTFVVVNLFIAVVINNLDEAKYAHLEKLEHPDLHDQLLTTLVSTKGSIQHLEKQLNALSNKQEASSK